MRGRRTGSGVAAALAAVLGVALAVGACAPKASPSGAFPALATTDGVTAPLTDDERKAIAFRTQNSLPAGIEHVRAVAIDPTATKEFGVPLLPAESAELMSRTATAEAIIAVVEAEGARSPNDYCGLYLDNANGGAVTSGWTSNRVVHEIAIRGKVRPDAPIAFIDCRFSQVDVNRVCDLLRGADFDWMHAIPAQIMGFGCGNRNFRVELEISSAKPGAADVVLQHYVALFQLPLGILAVESDGTGAALVPRGTVEVTVLGMDGERVGPNDLFLDWKPIDFPGIECGSEVGWGVPANAEPIELPCQAGAWRISVMGAPAPDQDPIEFGAAKVVVEAGKTVKLTIRLTKDPPHAA